MYLYLFIYTVAVERGVDIPTDIFDIERELADAKQPTNRPTTKYKPTAKPTLKAQPTRMPTKTRQVSKCIECYQLSCILVY